MKRTVFVFLFSFLFVSLIIAEIEQKVFSDEIITSDQDARIRSNGTILPFEKELTKKSNEKVVKQKFDSYSNPIVNETPGFPGWAEKDIIALKEEIQKTIVQRDNFQKAKRNKQDLKELEYTLGNFIGQALIRKIDISNIVDIYDRKIVTKTVSQSVFDYLHDYENDKYVAMKIMRKQYEPTRETPSGSYYHVNSHSTNPTMQLLSGATIIWDGSVGTYDNLSSDIPVGFDFFFYEIDNNDPNTEVRVSTNGYISMFQQGGGAIDGTDWTNDEITNTTHPNGYIAAWWDDLMIQDQGNTDKVSYKLEGAVGDRILTIEYYSVSRNDGDTGDYQYFQTVLRESNNEINLKYGQWLADSVSNATYGLENYSGLDGDGGSNTTNTNVEPPSTLRTCIFEPLVKKWQGNISTDWNDEDNWSETWLPLSICTAVIPAECPNYPELTGSLGINTEGFDYECKSLNIAEGASVILTNSSDIHNYGELTIEGNLEIGDDLFSYSGSIVDFSGTINVKTIYFENGSQFNGTSGEIFVAGDFIDENEIFSPTGGSVTFDESSVSEITGSPTFYDLNISKSGSTVTANSSFSIANELLLNSGVLNPNDNTIEIGGDWTNNVGDAGFIEGSGRVIFNGSDVQYCSSETFNILELDKPFGYFRTSPAADITCNAYDWTSGGIISADSGASFTALHLMDGGLYGIFEVHDGCVINLHQAGSYVDLNGIIKIYGGNMNVHGGSFDSWWSYGDDANITMTGGILDFKDQGIVIHNGGNSLTEDITGGIIRTSKGFTGDRANFNPAGGTIELYGLTDVYICHGIGSSFHHVNIDKSGTRAAGGTESYTDRNGNVIRTGRANSVQAFSDLDLSGDLLIAAGTFDPNGHTVNVESNVDIYGTMQMLVSADILNIGYNIYWRSGSNSNITNGEINLTNDWFFEDGTNAQFGINNTVNFVGSTNQFITCNDADAEFRNVNCDQTDMSVWFHSSSTQPMRVTGEMNILARTFNLQNEELIVDSTLDIQVGTVMNIGSSGSLTNNSNFTLNGELDADAGDALIHGYFELAETGILTIDGGSFISDAPYYSGRAWQYLRGDFNLSDGLFEITHHSISFASTCNDNITGGLIRIGHSFSAMDPNVFQPTDGEVEFTGTGGIPFIRCDFSDGNYFHDFVFNSAVEVDLYSDITIQDDIEINSGALNVGYDGTYYDIYIGGDWTNNVGDAGFIEGSGSVIFNGDEVQYCSSEIFNILEIDKAVGFLRALPEADITCDSYDWTSGGIYIGDDGAIFTAEDLVDDGLYGIFEVHEGCVINLHQQTGISVDLNGIIKIYGGNMNVHGGSFGSWWSYDDDVNITMTAGILDFKDQGIEIHNGIHYLTEDITGGTIRTSKDFTGDRADFNPAGGTIELYGSSDASLSHGIGSSFHNVKINKSVIRADEGNETYVDRNGNVIRNERSNTVLANSDLDIESDLLIAAGTFGLNGHTVNVESNVDIYGTMQMLVSADILNVGNNINWRSGSSDNITNGTINVYGNWTFAAGTEAVLEDYSTVYLLGDSCTLIINLDDNAEFANLIINKPSAPNDQVQLNGGNELCVNSFLWVKDGILNIYDNSALRINGDILVDEDGILELIGSSGNEILVTALGSNFAFTIGDGGGIGAEYVIFEKMDMNGLFIQPGALVDASYPLNNCTFQSGEESGTLLRIDNNQIFSVNNANFPANTWSGTSNVMKTVDSGEVTFYDASGDFSGEVFEDDTFNRINWIIIAPDLEITDVVWSSYNPWVCDEISVDVIVTNNGNLASEGCVIDLYYDLDFPPVPLQYGDKFMLIPEIPAGESETITFTGISHNVAEVWSSYLQIDSDNILVESDETNNIYGAEVITWNALPVIDDLTIVYNSVDEKIELNWTYPISVDRFKIYKTTDPYDFSEAIMVNTIGNSYQEEPDGNYYFYRVTAERDVVAKIINVRK
ncbi:MAG: hypothetical protein K8S23_16635 [Candidatus Cloacimonetes bacterium]|nr:hypothetical protein [Candidatus Cloacimonadota bacterium]